MAKIAPKDPAKEHRESLDSVQRKAHAVVKDVKKSKHFIAYTGAGISTSAGIADFRGSSGVWTLQRQGRERDIKSINILQAVPTLTHMALVELQNQGILKYLVSQNCDGLHRKSGILPDRISELHGNSNREYCQNCETEYMRDFRAVSTYEKSVHDHRTGRKCIQCGGVLIDSIINFGETLPLQPLTLARQHAKKADLCLVLGSSCTVPPANGIPETVGKKRNGKLVICNLQETPLDHLSSLQVHSDTDKFMVEVMKELGIAIPEFILHRRLIIKIQNLGSERHQLTVSGVDVDGTPMTFLKSVKLGYNRRVARAEPFSISFRGDLAGGDTLKAELEFMRHYGEPNLEIDLEYDGRGDVETLYALDYSPHTGGWKTSIEGKPSVGEGTVIDLTKDEDAVLLLLGIYSDSIELTTAANLVSGTSS